MKKSFIAPTIALFVLSVIMALSVPANAEYTYNRTMEIGESITVTTSSAPTSYVPSGSVFRSYLWSSSNLSIAGIIPSSNQCTIIALSPGNAVVDNKQSMSYKSYNIALKMDRSMYEQGFGDTWIIRVLYPELALKEVLPENGTVEQDSDTDIVFTYNTTINEGAAYSSIKLEDNQTGEAVDIEKSITDSSLTLKPSARLQAGHSYTATVPAGALQNPDGKALAAASAMSFRVNVAEITEISPADGAVNTPVDTPIVIKYDSNIKKGSAWNGITIKNKETDENVPYTSELNGNTITLIPQSHYSYNTLHELTIPAGAVANSQGAETAKARTFTFTTKPGNLSAVFFSPENGAEDIPVDTKLQVAFNFPISAGDAIDNITLTDKASGQKAEGTAAVSGSTLTFTPNEKLNYQSGYTLTIPPNALVNNADEPNSYEITVGFTTMSQENETVNTPIIEQEDLEITITAESGANIYYTTDNTNPVTNGTRYTEPFTIGKNDAIIRAVAVKNGTVSEETVHEVQTLIQTAWSNFGGSGGDGFSQVISVEDGFIAVGDSYADSFGNGDWMGIEGNGNRDAVIVKYDKDLNKQWQKHFGGSGNDSFNSIISVEDGFIAVGGSYGESFNSGDWEGISGNGEEDAIIVKYDNDGNIKWQKYFGGADDDYFGTVIATNDGGFAAIGGSDQSSFNNGDWKGTTAKGYTDGIIVKYDSEGNKEWNTSFGGRSWDYFLSLAESEDGYVVVGYSDTSSFYYGDWANISSNGNEDAFIVKFDTNGKLAWKKNFGGKGWDEFRSVIATDNGFYAVGKSGAASFGNGDLSGVTGKGYDDAIVVKYYKNGSVAWKKNFGGSVYDAYTSVTEAEDGFIAIGYSDVKNGDWGNISGNGNGDAVVVKYNDSGDVEWKRNFGGSGSDYFYSLASSENVMMAVGNSAANSFGNGDWKGIEGKGESDAVIVKYSPPVRADGTDTDGSELKELFILGNTRIGAPAQYSAAFFPNTAEDKAVVWSVSDESVATIDTDGTLTPLKNGSVTVTVKNKDRDIEKSLEIEISGTKTYIGAMTSNTGAFAEDYDETDTERILYVPKDTPSVSLTASFDGGSIISDYGELSDSIAKEIAIDELPKTITLTKREADHDDVVYTITIKKEREKEQTPDIKIDFENEMLTGFSEDGEYTINGNAVATSWGAISAENYIGTETTVLQIIKKAAGDDKLDSEPQLLEIPTYPDAPMGIGTVKASDDDVHDGVINGVNAAMEYRDESVGEWLPVSGAEIAGLSAGDYEVRYKATETAFASAAVTVSIGVADKYKITFINYDNEILQIINVPIGSMPEYTGNEPERQDDEMYSYSFSGWKPEITAAAEDLTYTARFDATPREYRITLNLNGGEVIGNVTKYTYGTAITLPIPTRENYSFGGWYERADCTGTAVTEISAETTGDKTYYAKWTADVYSVTYETNGGLIENEEDYIAYSYGTGLILPIPIKENYHFVGWYGNEEFDGAAVTAIFSTDKGDKVYYAKWTEMEPSEYLITFVNYDNTLLQSEMAAVGEKAKYSGETPIKPSDDKYSYTFAGWSPEITETTGIAIYTAQFERTPIVYRVELTAEGKAAVLVPEAGTYALIFAAYDSGVLTGVELQSITIDKACEREFAPETLDINGADKIKVMLWEDIDRIKPLCGFDERGL